MSFVYFRPSKFLPLFPQHKQFQTILIEATHWPTKSTNREKPVKNARKPVKIAAVRNRTMSIQHKSWRIYTLGYATNELVFYDDCEFNAK